MQRALGKEFVSSCPERKLHLGTLLVEEYIWPPQWGEEGKEQISDLDWKDFSLWF